MPKNLSLPSLLSGPASERSFWSGVLGKGAESFFEVAVPLAEVLLAWIKAKREERESIISKK